MFPQPQIPAPKAPRTSNERRHDLRRIAGGILGEFSRVAGCGRKRISEHVTVARTTSGQVQYHGLMTCGSIWNCPVCASRIASRRAQEVSELLRLHAEAGGAVYMATLTVQHDRMAACADTRDVVRDAWRTALQGKGWKDLKEAYGVIGYVRSLELTHGANGWHPHLHVLIFTDRMADSEEKLAASLWSRWRASVIKHKGHCEEGGFDFQRASNLNAAAEYVSKWGAGSEISKGQEKEGRQGSRSPWQLLEAAGKGDKKAISAWREYSEAMHRARHMTYSVGLRKFYGLNVEADDEQLAMETETVARELYTFDDATWSLVVRKKLTASVLDAARSGDALAIEKLLASHGIGQRPRPTQYGHAPPPQEPSSKRIRYLGLREALNLKTGTALHG